MAADSAVIAPPKSQAPRAIFWGGLIAGIMDITAASLTTLWFGRSPIQMLQGIASGLLGPSALEGGYGSAALGLGIHFLIATTATAVYYLVSRKLGFMVRQAVLCGVLYGVAVYLFMYAVVQPLAFHRGVLSSFTSATAVIRAVLVHITCVGLPIALVVRRFSK